VRVRLGAEVHDLAAIGNGWWGTSLDAAPGTDYAYLLDEDEHGLPDPRSRWQPRGAHEASRVYDDSAYSLAGRIVAGRDWPGSILYELHIGTFTPEGTFDAAIERLSHLVDLGVTHVELLPVNTFNGSGTGVTTAWTGTRCTNPTAVRTG
jgi:maltooligosyltrehalose trehalohydrolase